MKQAIRTDNAKATRGAACGTYSLALPEVRESVWRMHERAARKVGDFDLAVAYQAYAGAVENHNVAELDVIDAMIERVTGAPYGLVAS